MGLREPGPFVYRETAAAEVVRAPNRNAQLNIQRSTACEVQFCDLGPQLLGSPRIIIAGGIRVFLGPMHPQSQNSVLLVSFQDGKLYVNDVAVGTQAPDPAARAGGTQIDPIDRQDVISSSGIVDSASLKLPAPGDSIFPR